MRPFSFKIILADHSNGDSYVKDCGFGFADTYTEAVKHLENAYGNQKTTFGIFSDIHACLLCDALCLGIRSRERCMEELLCES